MTDPQLPPPGAVPPPSPAPQPAYGQVPVAPPAYPTSPPAPPAYSSPAAPPAYPSAPAPTHQAAPPGAYQVPVGGYSAPAGQYQVPTVEKKSSLLGVLALISALVAAVVVPIIGGVAGFQIGMLIPGGIDTSDQDFLSVLSPARDQVLWAEIAFWIGTILGIAALVIGIIAIRRKQGRGQGIAAVVVSVIGPVIFWLAVLILVSAGTAAGFLP